MFAHLIINIIQNKQMMLTHLILIDKADVFQTFKIK